MSADIHGILSDHDISQLCNSAVGDPFSILGMHPKNGGIAITTVHYGAAQVKVYDDKGKFLGDMYHLEGTPIFTLFFKDQKSVFKYELEVFYGDGFIRKTADPYSFMPVMTNDDLYLFNEGNNLYIYEKMGAHQMTIDGIEGVCFSVWAPSAQRVAVVGEFNMWDGRQHPMRPVGSSGVWELFLPGVKSGAVYKYEIRKAGSGHLVLKSDPYGTLQQPFPYHGSIVCSTKEHRWNDEEWIKKRTEKGNHNNQPMTIYELHLGSWKKSGCNEEGDYHNYKEIAKLLVPYIKEMGYTHIELMPVQEHPFVPSWGYQVGGFYAVNHRFGSPQDFQWFVDYLHQHDIGIILDWVPGHFPKDEHALAHFDGTHLYEHADPREGEHKDWGTLIFNYGRHEVRNFLVANAVYWIKEYHIDGLRVDAVASMLYRDYSRKSDEWVPNSRGGNENLEAIGFLQQANWVVREKFPGVLTIAEESTAFPGVTYPIEQGGLGFNYKWNMGWMHDTLDYFQQDPINRKYHQADLTYCLWYAWSEKFMLVLSHDEVVHGKRSLLEKMPGDDWQKFANMRLLYGFMYGHPGKKLCFMGAEFGMKNEWYEKREIDWHLLDERYNGTYHSSLHRMVKDLNKFYLANPAMWEDDITQENGWEWVDYNDRDNCVIAFIRKSKSQKKKFLFVLNFTPVIRHDYHLGVPYNTKYKEVFNSNAKEYGGEGLGNGSKAIAAKAESSQGKPNTLVINLPPLAFNIFEFED
ncbi:MAG: 1,4-alpha-glucan branching protein GlgB [Chitinivibrionia bacterium]|nr:1,4-alpha-glucan branching protein GlgB [Chitinivibrionia bacterium]